MTHNNGFTVPVEDIGQATLMRQDKAITFMRWIRKAIEGGTFINTKTQNDEQH